MKKYIPLIIFIAALFISCGEPDVLRFHGNGGLSLGIVCGTDNSDEANWPDQFTAHLTITGAGMNAIEQDLSVHRNAQDSTLFNAQEIIEVPVGDTLTIRISAQLDSLVWSGETNIILEAGSMQNATVSLNAENRFPNTSSDPHPVNGAVSVDTSQVFLMWTGGDPDPGDTVMYQVNWGTTLSLDSSSTWLPFNEYFLNNLSSGTHYFWRVTAQDNFGAITPGPIWEFFTVNAGGNNAPTTPANPTPQNGATGIDTLQLVMNWTSTDPDQGDTLTFSLDWGTTPQLGNTVPGLIDPQYVLNNLQAGAHYYWRVTAEDNHGAATAGAVWEFFTISGVVNQPPGIPSNPSPISGMINVDTLQVIFSWNSFDPDPSDTVTYRIDYGTSLALEDSITGLTEFIYLMPALQSGAQYYWQVTATDNHGASTAGPVWQFSTVARG
ncbi:MAG: hypothetical protein NTW14_08855 [bacterium]|nr:hypothetical protein [bacterium]